MLGTKTKMIRHSNGKILERIWLILKSGFSLESQKGGHTDTDQYAYKNMMGENFL